VSYSAEVLKSALRKSSSGSSNASPVLEARANIAPSSTLLVKKAGGGNTLTPLGPLGLSLRDDDSSSTSTRPQQPAAAAAAAGYSSDELQVLRSTHISYCSLSLTPSSVIIVVFALVMDSDVIFCQNLTNVSFFTLDQGDHLSGKPGNVGEFDHCQGNVRDSTKSQGKILSG